MSDTQEWCVLAHIRSKWNWRWLYKKQSDSVESRPVIKTKEVKRDTENVKTVLVSTYAIHTALNVKQNKK